MYHKYSDGLTLYRTYPIILTCTFGQLVLCLKSTNGMVTSADSDRLSKVLIWVYTVCSDYIMSEYLG